MSFSITHNSFEPGKDYLLLAYEGEVSMATIVEHAPAVLKKIKEEKITRLVEDYRKVKFNLSSIDINNMQKLQMDLVIENGISYNQLKRALVVDRDQSLVMDIEFLEKLNLNRGVSSKVFTDLYKAIQWVVGD